VVETSDLKEKCPSTEDNTVLTLLVDKGVRAIKPKQRVIAVNNIAKFFGLPYVSCPKWKDLADRVLFQSAFTLKPQLEKDDITDSSVVLAGPGNLHSRSSKLTSLIQVPVGCDGRLWLQTAPLVHQLKQQARDGTITEVIGLPVVGWRVKTETRPVLRSKRQIDDYGSGDYEDYYDDNYDDEEYEDEDDVGAPTKAVTPPTTTMTPTPTHPHRHHHGEALNPEEIDPVSTRASTGPINFIRTCPDYKRPSSPVNFSESRPNGTHNSPSSTRNTSANNVDYYDHHNYYNDHHD
jgi:dystroglycan 1